MAQQGTVIEQGGNLYRVDQETYTYYDTVFSEKTKTDFTGFDDAPIARPKFIYFKATGLRPNTRHFAYFNRTDVSNFISTSISNVTEYRSLSRSDPKRNPGEKYIRETGFPTELGGPSASILSDASGTIEGVFYLQSNNIIKFPAGTNTLSLIDINVLDPSTALSFSSANFTVDGGVENYATQYYSVSNSVARTGVKNNLTFIAPVIKEAVVNNITNEYITEINNEYITNEYTTNEYITNEYINNEYVTNVTEVTEVINNITENITVIEYWTEDTEAPEDDDAENVTTGDGGIDDVPEDDGQGVVDKTVVQEEKKKEEKTEYYYDDDNDDNYWDDTVHNSGPSEDLPGNVISRALGIEYDADGDGDTTDGDDGCVIATHGVKSGGFTPLEKAKAVLWCERKYHNTFFGEALRRGYRYTAGKAIQRGDAEKYYQEFKDFVAYGRGVKKGWKYAVKYYYRTAYFIAHGLFIRDEKV